MGVGRWAGGWARSFGQLSRRRTLCFAPIPHPPSPTSSRIHPLSRPVSIVLELPDRHTLLELLDHVAARVIGRAAMRMRDDDHHARFAELEHADAMFDDDVARVEFCNGLA